MKSRIIWCTGAAGTGKTVLNNKLQEHFEQLGYQVVRLESVSRSICEKMGIASPKQLTEENYFDFQRAVLEKQISFDMEAFKDILQNDDGGKIYLSDRCATCYTGFAAVYGPKFGDINMRNYLAYQTSMMMDWADLTMSLMSLNSATILFVEPHGGEIERDGVRPDNVVDQQIVSTTIRCTLLNAFIDNRALDSLLFATSVNEFATMMRADSKTAFDKYPDMLHKIFSELKTAVSQTCASNIANVGRGTVEQRVKQVIDYINNLDNQK